MTDEKLLQIQNELMREIDGEGKKEKMVKEMSIDIAAKLTLSNKTYAYIEDTEYAFAYKEIALKKGKGIFITVANMNKFRILREKYTPYTVTAEIDNNFSLRENLTSTVEAYLRHILDMIKPEEI